MNSYSKLCTNIKKTDMVFIVNSFEEENQNDQELYFNNEAETKEAKHQEVLTEVITQMQDANGSKVNWVDSNTVEVSCLSGLCIHSFVLELEKLGKKVSYEKKTYLKIAD
jgi:hypothetical protein